ncbi:RidA family protein [Streptomyces sp. SID13666]|uniref:RidA family protein n=1 Tax=unclassified Streptomyces TaxID=2593676 RepID=UPI0013BF0F08|nr:MULTISPECIES: RidA family protein [unclassified Streptomyces]NEA54663.1 RidA family protein [Streptomyces sp. SID13666]NEA70452.1 RidA family protein [Streptomyces sp. SID13588]
MSDNRTLTNPAGLHDPTPFGYSHAASAPGESVFIGGQYASDESGQVVPGDFAAQVERSVANLRIALAGVGLGLEHVVRLGSYIVDHDLEKLEILGKALHGAWADRLPAQTLVGVAALALPGMLFEIDAVAVRPTEKTDA